MERIIVSMTTMPSRKRRFQENLESVLNQTYRFDKLVINVQHEEDLDWYKKIAKPYDRIEINLCDEKWRSCNKLIPTLEKYRDDVIITIDDDIYYPIECIERLVNKHIEYPDCIIAHEINPIIVNMNNKTLSYVNGFDVMLEQIEYGKYLSNCTLFPIGCFDNTEIFDFDKMMKYTNGEHDELWFWINSTLNHVKSIGLPYVYTFMGELKSDWEDGEFKLADINCKQEKINEYMSIINKDYGSRLFEIITKELPQFFVTPENVQTYIPLSGQIKSLYNYGFTLNFKSLTSVWRNTIIKIFNQQQPDRAFSYGYFKKEIKDWIVRHFKKDDQILDVGAGCGTYWNLLHDSFENIDAVEVFKPNIEDFKLESKYNYVFNSDIKDFVYEHYDLIIFGDIIEHLDVEEAQKVLEYANDRCRDMIVAVPYMLPQDDFYGNKYEIHKQPDLTPENVLERYPMLKLLYANDKYGYYIKK